MLDQKGARTLDEVILSEGLINLPDKA
jgi:hypothetical protein